VYPMSTADGSDRWYPTGLTDGLIVFWSLRHMPIVFFFYPSVIFPFVRLRRSPFHVFLHNSLFGLHWRSRGLKKKQLSSDVSPQVKEPTHQILLECTIQFVDVFHIFDGLIFVLHFEFVYGCLWVIGGEIHLYRYPYPSVFSVKDKSVRCGKHVFSELVEQFVPSIPIPIHIHCGGVDLFFSSCKRIHVWHLRPTKRPRVVRYVNRNHL